MITHPLSSARLASKKSVGAGRIEFPVFQFAIAIAMIAMVDKGPSLPPISRDLQETW